MYTYEVIKHVQNPFILAFNIMFSISVYIGYVWPSHQKYLQ